MKRQILHVDMNHFYASVEQAYDPSLKGIPMAVTGKASERHGIILAKSPEAKAMGVKTGEVIWQAQQKCPELVLVDAHFDRYHTFSQLARSIYLEYTDRVEPYGMDECWLDVTGSQRLFGDGETIARTLRRRIREELGVTVSIGISDNKLFAKLGSDYKKPDAQTVMTRENMVERVWPLPAGDLLFVGRHTEKALHDFGIHTIGEIAQSDPTLLRHRFGINGLYLWRAANGCDQTPIARFGEKRPPQSVSCGTTFREDLRTTEEVKLALLCLAEHVEQRLIDAHAAATRLSLSLRDCHLNDTKGTVPLDYPTTNATSLLSAALTIADRYRDPNVPLRAMTLSASRLFACDGAVQSAAFSDIVRFDKRERVSRTMYTLRERFGQQAAERASLASFSSASIDPTRPTMPVNLFVTLGRMQRADMVG